MTAVHVSRRTIAVHHRHWGGQAGGRAIGTGVAAKMLGVSAERVRKLTADGRIKLLRRDARGYRLLSRASVEKLIREREFRGV